MQATPVALYSRRNDDPCVITFAFVQRPDNSQPDFTTAGWVVAYAGRLQDAVGTPALSATSANNSGSYVERTANGFKLHFAHADLNPTSPQTPYSHDAGPITDPRMWDQASNGLVNIDGPWVQGDTAHALDFGDGFGAYHSREGFGWAFVKALAAFHGATFGVGGQTIQVFNMAIGGTTVQNTLNTQGRANALYPDRINALTGYIQAQVALGKTVLVLDGFGTNDVGGSYVYANQLQLFGLYKAAGAEVMKITCGRPDPRYQPDPTAWYKCVGDNVRAAKDAGVAYFDTTEILSSAMLPALGLADQQVCSGNLLNHESAAVWRAIGQAAAAPLLA